MFPTSSATLEGCELLKKRLFAGSHRSQQGTLLLGERRAGCSLKFCPQRLQVQTEIVGGLLLDGMAAGLFRRRGTAVEPWKPSTVLIHEGPYRFSRNPIYLGDALVLAGLALRWETPIALLLVPLFMGTITQRFIVPEENRLRVKFRADFARYCQNTRRWV